MLGEKAEVAPADQDGQRDGDEVLPGQPGQMKTDAAGPGGFARRLFWTRHGRILSPDRAARSGTGLRLI